MAPYDLRSQPTSTATSHRALLTPQLDIGMPTYHSGAMDNAMALNTGGYGYAPSPNGPYQSLVPNYGASYPTPSAQSMGPARAMTQSLRSVDDGYRPFPPEQPSPAVKAEEGAAFRNSAGVYDGGPVLSTSIEHKSLPESGEENKFATGVDNLMKTIQSKASPSRPRPQSAPQALASIRRRPREYQRASLTYGYHSSNVLSPNAHQLATYQQHVPEPKAKKRYECSVPDCGKGFSQKTHLEIHMRAHTGAKPFLCKEPSCGQRFSQLGNLKTHERRHTGERPYRCDECGKRFAQRGNVRAHKIVHQQTKPFVCKLDNCGKQFTQLGNLKSHQNKFHIAVLTRLTQQFATIREGEQVSAADREMWEYFATLYKNSNKGIKGRGKDRKIAATSQLRSSNGNMPGDGGSESPTASQSSQSHHGAYDFNHGGVDVDGGSPVVAAYVGHQQHQPPHLPHHYHHPPAHQQHPQQQQHHHHPQQHQHQQHPHQHPQHQQQHQHQHQQQQQQQPTHLTAYGHPGSTYAYDTRKMF
ncbi:MAG: hypothetical protein M1817_006547 [Caeruleum heppii]|nr:MAG: hypothetical protein M1817_006547 [Caeruleum heppii]